MAFKELDIPGLWLFEPRLFEDERGYFFESFNQKRFKEETGNENLFVQDNHSLSYYGVMRGLHFQNPPFAQAKLVRVIRGEVLDVAVDIRPDSPTFGQHDGVILSAENKKQLFIPRGFAHGFIVLSKEAELLYKCDNYYAPQAESGIMYNDPELAINWSLPEKDIIISDKDAALKSFSALELTAS